MGALIIILIIIIMSIITIMVIIMMMIIIMVIIIIMIITIMVILMMIIIMSILIMWLLGCQGLEPLAEPGRGRRGPLLLRQGRDREGLHHGEHVGHDGVGRREGLANAVA